MDVEFVLPTKHEELCSVSSTQYVVNEVSSVREVTGEVLGFQQSLSEDGVEFIFKNFDTYYSMIRHFTQLAEEVKIAAYEVLLKASEKLINELNLFLEDEDDAESGLSFKYRNLLKMAVYLLCTLAELHETEATKPSLVITETRKSRKAKKSVKDDHWSCLRKDFVKFIDLIYRLPISKLWKPPIVEGEFVNLVIRSFFKIMENPQVEDQGLNEEIIDFLGYSLKVYKGSIGYSVKIIHSVQDFAHLVPILSSAVHIFVTKYGAQQLIPELFKEVCCLEFHDMVRDTARLHLLSQFLVELSEKCFTDVLASINVLLPCLEEESHIIRNCVLTIIGELTAKISTLQDISSDIVILRDKLLSKLLGHIHDVSAFVRSKSLQVSSHLFEQGAMPILQQKPFLDVAIGRLNDKASLVRKSAIHFLKLFIIVNSYAVQLPIEELKKSYEKENATLQELLPVYLSGNPKPAALVFSSDEECSDGSDNEHGVDENKNNAGPSERTESNDDKNKPRTKEEVQDVERGCNDSNDSDGLDDKISQQQVLVQYLKRTLEYAESITNALPKLCILLKSTTTSDVTEVIDFFTAAFQLGWRNAVLGIKEMMHLIFSKEPAVKNAVVSSYKTLYLTAKDEKNKSVRASMIAKNLILFLHGATDAEVLAIEEFVKEFIKSGDITSDVQTVLWDTFVIKSSTTTDEESLSSLVLLSMAASVDINIVIKNLDLLLSVGLGPRAASNFFLAKETCSALLKINTSSKISVESAVPQFRLHETHNLFVRIAHLLTNGVTNNDSQWTAMADKAVRVIFQLADHPESICKKIILHIAQTFLSHRENGSDVAAMVFCRLLFISGHIVYCCAIFLETDMFNELKRRVYLKRKINQRVSLNRSLSRTSGKKSYEVGDIEDTASDDYISEFIAKLCEEILNENNMLGKLYPVVVETCEWTLKNPDKKLCAVSSLTLAKFMFVSARICEENMQLIVTLMENCPDPDIRSNVVIAMGNLITRFPNEVEPWTPNLYQRLRDDDASVRLNAVIILTHLILHDMIKIKGHIGEIALCIVDNKEIADVAKYLFSGLSKKKNTLYNVLPDLISSLSSGSCNQLNEADYQIIIKYIFQFIEKDRQVEGLVEKLCLRLKDASTPIQLHKIAFSLSLFTFNDKCFQKLMDNKACYKDKLDDKVLVMYLKEITTSAKKTNPKLEPDIDAFLSSLNI